MTDTCWTAFADTEPALLRDSTLVIDPAGTFRGSVLQASLNWIMRGDQFYRTIQLVLVDVDEALIHGVKDVQRIRADIVREVNRYESQLQFEYDLLLRSNVGEFVSPGAVCLALEPGLQESMSMDVTEKREEVSRAASRGLLDDAGYQRADFRLNNRSKLSRLAAMRDSGYVPDNEWTNNVMFCHWFERETNTQVQSPLDEGGDTSSVELVFTPAQIDRGFRVSDLFGK